MIDDSRHQLAVAVERLLDLAYPPGEIVSHSPDCPGDGERCIAHALLRAFRIEHADSVCDDVTAIVRRWLTARQIPIPIPITRHPEWN